MSPLMLALNLFHANDLGPTYYPDAPWWVWVLLPFAPLLLPAAALLHLVGLRINLGESR